MDRWRILIAAQGGDPDAALPVARESHDLLAEHDGVLTTMDAYAVGVAAWRLGAGRARRGDPVSAGAGVRLHAKPGDRVTAGQPLATMFADDPARFARAEAGLAAGVTVSDPGTAAPAGDLVLARIELRRPHRVTSATSRSVNVDGINVDVVGRCVVPS